NTLESNLEELDCELLRHFIDENLQLDTIFAKKPGKNIAFENIISILFELLMSQSEHDSEEAMNIFIQGINKRKDFRITVCGRGGILRRSAQVFQQPLFPEQIPQSSLSLSSSSHTAQFIPIHSLLNFINVLLELTKSGIRQWDPIEADEFLFELIKLNERLTKNENEKDQIGNKKSKHGKEDVVDEDQNEDEEENEKTKFIDNIQSLVHMLSLKGLNKVNSE
ncbi:MAG: hypothetical protein EZS28_042944, partial [Streblomastix strix]